MTQETSQFEVQGHIVPLTKARPDSTFAGRVRMSGDRIERVLHRRFPPPTGFTQVDVGDAFVYPGLIDMHSHLGYAPLPMWSEPSRPADRPWLNRNNWPNAKTYKPAVSWPGYAYMKGAPEALLAYAQVRALAGGTTAIQGWPAGYGRLVNKLIRNVDDDIDPDWIRTSVINLSPVELDDRRDSLDVGRALIYHLCEGQRDSTVAGEFTDAARANCLRHRLFAIHCNAVGEAEFAQWQIRAAADDGASPGGVVWSPLSNLWLYGETTDVMAARRHDITICLGSDWGPSGSKNLLNEMKVAYLFAARAGLDLSTFDIVTMATSAPGDLLDRVPSWTGFAGGRLEPGRAADLVVVTRHTDDPWRNLVMATERDVELVVVDGQARYGTRQRMRQAGQRNTTSVPLGRARRHVPLRSPVDERRRWTWTSVRADLERVRSDPHHAIEVGLGQAMAALAGDDEVTAEGQPLLVLEPDMPGGAGQVAGPPPPGAEFSVPPVESLAHDRRWLSSVKDAGYDGALLAELTTVYRR